MKLTKEISALDFNTSQVFISKELTYTLLDIIENSTRDKRI